MEKSKICIDLNEKCVVLWLKSAVKNALIRGTFLPSHSIFPRQLFTFHSSFFTCSTVGYITDNLTKGNFNAVAINFTSVDGKGFQLNDISGEGLYGSTDGYTADQIKIWNPLTSGYENWFYWFDESDHSWDGWWDFPNAQVEFKDTHPDGLANGTAVWYLSHSNSSGGAAILPGAIDTAKSVTLSLTRGNFNQVANPFPVGLQPNNSEQVTWENATGSTDGYAADQIKIWNPETSGYENWFYWFDESDHSWDGWWDFPNAQVEFQDVHPDGLPAGIPVWYNAAGTFGQKFDVTFKTPLK